MAKKGAKGAGRVGRVKGRAQTYNPKTELWAKRDTTSGRFVQEKKTGGSFKGVKRER